MMPKKAAGKAKISIRNAKLERTLHAFHVLALSVTDFCETLKTARRQFHSSELPDPKWNVLSILEHRGPQTVPQIARSRKISRQAVQNTVNALSQDGIVDFADNPAHRTSPLVVLTGKGRILSAEMNSRETEALSDVRIDVRPPEMLQAADVLQRLQAFFESDQWKKALARSQKN